MPNTLSIGLGGGSHIKETEGHFVSTFLHCAEIYIHMRVLQTIGPTSVGYRITDDALCSGGNVLTATDVAAVAGMVPGIDTNALSVRYSNYVVILW